MLDIDDDDDTMCSSTSAKFDVLEQAIDDLYEKRGATREKALDAIINAFNRNMEYEFVDKMFETLLHLCLNSIKKGSSKEIALAGHAIGLLALTVGCGDKGYEIFEQSFSPISHALKSPSDAAKITSLIECLAIVTFVGGNETEETDQSMQIMWQYFCPKLGPNYGHSPETILKIGWNAMATSTWSQSLQLNFLKHFLGGGFHKHMQDNTFLQDVLQFTPKITRASGTYTSSIEKKMYKSPNSIVSKARTWNLTKQGCGR